LSTKDKNVIIIRWVPVFLFLIIGGGLWYLAEWRSDIENTDQQVSAKVNSVISLYKSLLSDSDFSEGHTAHPYLNFVKTEDNIPAIWNFSEQVPSVSNAFNYVEYLESGVIYINLFNRKDSLINQNITKSLNLTHKIKLSSIEDQEGMISIGNQQHPVKYELADHWYQRWLVLIMFLCFIWFASSYLGGVSNLSSLTVPIFVLLLMRLGLYLTKDWIDVGIFDLTNETSLLFPSVGDYVTNIIFCLAILFLTKKVIKLNEISPNAVRILSFVNGAIMAFLIYHFASLIEGFILNAGYDVDIGSIILFDTSSIVLVISMILHQILIGFYVIYSVHALKRSGGEINVLGFHLVGVALATLGCYSLVSFNGFILGGFVAAYLIMMDLFLDSKRKSVVWLIWWMVIHCLLITSLVYYNGLRKDKIVKKETIQAYFIPPIEEDYFTIKNIKDAVLNADTKNIISTLPYPSRLESEDIQSFLSETILESSSWDLDHIYLLDNNLRSLIINSRYDSYTLNGELNTSRLINEGIHYNYLTNSYLVLDTIRNEDNPGSPFIIGTSFNNQTASDQNDEAFIIVKNEQIVYPEITYFDKNTINSILGNTEDFSTDLYHFTVFPVDQNVKITSYRPKTGLIKPMSLFSYLFTVGGIVIVLIGLLNTKYSFIQEPIHLKVDHKTSLRNKLQTGFIAMLIFSFIIIGLLTAIYFKNVIEGNETSISNEQWGTIINSVRNEAYLSQDGESAIVKIQNKLPELSLYYPHVIQLFDGQGQLQYSSDASDNTVRIPWNLFNDLKTNLQVKSITQENHRKSYVPLFYEGKEAFAFLSIENPGMQTGYQSIYDFIGTLLNVYVFLFLLAGAIGIFLSNSITMPLRNLADKLKEFKIGRQNEPLKWEGNDEIGQLINDYNNLIHQVQESDDIIARTERDTAWREMAKQVAHEIKNPLTPMKLSLQYLQRAIQSEGVDPKPMIERVSATLIEQIDNLSNIANEFSNFAKMPKSNNEKVILNELVEAVHDLFRKRDDMDITLSEPINELYVFADRNQLVRILNNLVKNAIQAIPTDRRGKINIALYQRDQNAVVEVKDNGIGIPDHMKNKVFTPNFTTKSSGTGLGLAISANIIEGFNGKIYFDTDVNEGTRFYVEIPLMRLSEHSTGVQRVTLD